MENERNGTLFIADILILPKFSCKVFLFFLVIALARLLTNRLLVLYSPGEYRVKQVGGIKTKTTKQNNTHYCCETNIV